MNNPLLKEKTVRLSSLTFLMVTAALHRYLENTASDEHTKRIYAAFVPLRDALMLSVQKSLPSAVIVSHFTDEMINVVLLDMHWNLLLSALEKWAAEDVVGMCIIGQIRRQLELIENKPTTIEEALNPGGT